MVVVAVLAVGIAAAFMIMTGLGAWRRGDRSISRCVLCALVFPATWAAWTWLDLYADGGGSERSAGTPWWLGRSHRPHRR